MGPSLYNTPYPGYPYTTYKYFETYDYVSLYAFPRALELIVESVSAENEDRLFYTYLLSVAPRDQREIVASIRDDELRHFKMLREIYWEVTGEELPPAHDVPFQEPETYCAGITQALFGELGAVERYRQVLFGFEFLPYRNMLTEIITDEIKHSAKWNYLFALNCR